MKHAHISVERGDSVYEAELARLKDRVEVLEQRVATVTGLMAGFDDASFVERWKDLPRLPIGWNLVRALRGWLQQNPAGLSDVEHALWLVEGHSQELTEALNRIDASAATKLAEVLLELRSTEMPRQTHPMPSPDLYKYRRIFERLRSETDWLLAR